MDSKNIVLYNKLVRDNISKIIAVDGAESITRILEQKEYINCLKKKLIEETQEFLKAEEKEDQIKELADVSEVVKTLQENLNIDESEVEKTRLNLRKKRGSFNKKIFLVSTIGGSYTSK